MTIAAIAPTRSGRSLLGMSAGRSMGSTLGRPAARCYPLLVFTCHTPWTARPRDQMMARFAIRPETVPQTTADRPTTTHDAPPGPGRRGSLRLIGERRRDPLGFMARLHRRPGATWCVFGWGPVRKNYIVFHPTDVRRVLQDNITQKNYVCKGASYSARTKSTSSARACSPARATSSCASAGWPSPPSTASGWRARRTRAAREAADRWQRRRGVTSREMSG